MSRTFRRKNHIPQWVKQESVWDGNAISHVMLEGKELLKKLSWWHGDSLRTYSDRKGNKGFRKSLEIKHRSECKAELAKFHKNPEHELLILARGKRDWWD